jgi:hypothetical protein
MKIIMRKKKWIEAMWFLCLWVEWFLYFEIVCYNIFVELSLWVFLVVVFYFFNLIYLSFLFGINIAV